MKNDTSPFANIPALYKPAQPQHLGKSGNIPADAYDVGVANGEIVPLHISVNGNEFPFEIGIEHPALAIGQNISKSSLIQSYIKSAIIDQMSALRFWLKLIPSPKSAANYAINKDHFWSFSENLPAGENELQLWFNLNGVKYDALKFNVVALPTLASKYLTISNKRAISTVLPCTFECMPYSDGSDTALRSKINDFLKIQPSLLAISLLSTDLVSKSDFETTFSTIQRYYNVDFTVESMLALLPKFDSQTKELSKILKVLDVRTPYENLDTNIEFLRDSLNKSLQVDKDIIANTNFAFSLYHYGLPKYDYLVSHDEVMTPLFGYGFIHKMHKGKQSELVWLVNNLLPEFANDDTSFNLKKFISLSPRLISSFSLQANHLGSIVPAPNLSTIVSDANLIHSKSLELNLLSKAPITIDEHEATLPDRPVFEGDISLLPNFDKDFFDNLKSDFLEGGGVRISGVQQKALLNLSSSAGRNILRLSKGNIPSTHISKWPMLGQIDNLAVSEWLGLTLARAGGLNVSKFQLVNSSWSSTELENNESLYKSDRVLEGQNEFFNFTDIEQVKAALPNEMRTSNIDRHPPFIVIERFDLGYENNNTTYQFISRDFCMLAERPSKAKYNFTMEGVANLLKKFIKDPVHLNEAQYHLLKLLVTSLSVANNDLHLKNITLLEEYQNGSLTKTSLSPVYDVLVAPMVSPIIRNSPYTQALSIAGTRRPSLGQVRDFAAEHLDMSPEEASVVIRETISGIKDETIRLSKDPTILGKDPFLVKTLQFGLSLVKENLISLMTHGVEKSPNLTHATKSPSTTLDRGFQ